MKQSDIKVLRLEVGKLPVLVTIPNTLAAFQKEVGGYIEPIMFHDGRGKPTRMILYVNEDGHRLHLPFNMQLGPQDGSIHILGNALVVHHGDKGLTRTDITTLAGLLGAIKEEVPEQILT